MSSRGDDLTILPQLCFSTASGTRQIVDIHLIHVLAQQKQSGHRTLSSSDLWVHGPIATSGLFCYGLALMYAHKQGPRAEYREQQGKRVAASPSLAEKYSKLKSLTVDVGYFAPKGLTKYRTLTYDVNLAHAKSVFRLECCNAECVQGDFELTKELAAAAAKRTKTVDGELCCQGWHNSLSIKKVKCNHVLRYKLKLGY